jgi:hypothetical protein
MEFLFSENVLGFTKTCITKMGNQYFDHRNICLIPARQKMEFILILVLSISSFFSGLQT